MLEAIRIVLTVEPEPVVRQIRGGEQDQGGVADGRLPPSDREMKLSRRFDFAVVLAGLALSGTALAQQTTPAAGAHGPPAAPAEATGDFAGDYEVLQPLGDEPGQIELDGYGPIYYIPSTPETVEWGYLPNRDAQPILTVPSGSIVVFDTVSQEGIHEDQGRDPVSYFGSSASMSATCSRTPGRSWRLTSSTISPRTGRTWSPGRWPSRARNPATS